VQTGAVDSREAIADRKSALRNSVPTKAGFAPWPGSPSMTTACECAKQAEPEMAADILTVGISDAVRSQGCNSPVRRARRGLSDRVETREGHCVVARYERRISVESAMRGGVSEASQVTKSPAACNEVAECPGWRWPVGGRRRGQCTKPRRSMNGGASRNMKAIECVCCGWRDYEMLSPRH